MAAPQPVCGQNIAVVVGLRRLQAAEPETERKLQAKPRCKDQQTRAVARRSRATATGAIKSCAAPVTNMIVPISERVVSSDEGEKDRHEVH